MPSPSQEARELQEMTPPAPAPKARRPVWKPPPRFAARGPQVVKRAMPPPPPPPQPKAPGFRQTPTPRAPLPPLQLSQAIEPVLPFFSTQDFMLSSQDIRDLQDTTETPSKLPGKGTSRTTAIRANDKETPSKPQKPPSRPGKATVQARVNVTTQHTTIPAVTFDRPQFPQPPRYVLRISQPPTPVCTPGASGNPSQLSQPQPRANRLNPVLSNPALAHVAGPSQRRLRSSPLAQQQDVTAAQSKPLTFENYRPTTASPAPIQPSPAQLIQAVEQDPLPKRDPSPKPETPKASASPKKGRFFTASNEQVQLAMEKSLRTHKEEQRKREAEQRALKLEEERRAREQRALMQEAERKARQRRRQEEEALMEPCWDMEDLWQECETDGETDSGDPERCLSRRERQQNRFDERMNEEVARIEAREAERERSMDFYNEHAADEVESRKEDALAEARYEAELRAEELQKEESKTEVLKNGDLKGTVKEDPYDLDADFEELLGAELDLVDVKSSTSPGDVKQGTMVFMASQETDYGDMDVTLEDLDDFL
ncbi:hypothetical protein GE09DRAFT_1231996 [Coniochaeta sp. 2T2.1]|nr:hypothetical protein GE09DRAFT_1231996 [Coniochaeta sp. 2T2.1]